jgi:hypothetical protein
MLSPDSLTRLAICLHTDMITLVLAQVFWMEPDRGPKSRTVVIAQITGVASGSAQAVLQGRSAGGKAEDWSELLVWKW